MSKNYLKSLNPFKIFSILKERRRRFKKATNEEIPQLYSVNALANELHFQFLFCHFQEHLSQNHHLIL